MFGPLGTKRKANRSNVRFWHLAYYFSRRAKCPFSGVKRTLFMHPNMSANDQSGHLLARVHSFQGAAPVQFAVHAPAWPCRRRWSHPDRRSGSIAIQEACRNSYRYLASCSSPRRCLLGQWRDRSAFGARHRRNRREEMRSC